MLYYEILTYRPSCFIPFLNHYPSVSYSFPILHPYSHESAEILNCLFVRNTLNRLGLNTNNLGHGLLVLNNILHEGEGKHLLDAVVVRQEHDKTVDTQAPTTGGWQAVFKGLAESLVNELGLVVTGCFLVRLLFL
jgi:hypothetical protein